MTDSDDYAIRTINLSKVYRIPIKGKGNFLGSLAVTFDALRGRYGERHSAFRHFSALEPVNLEIGHGESVGIVGRNGSGKSTLLQIIAGTLQQTTGEVDARGPICALLQLGSGFNPEFTGMENIFLNGAMLGLTKKKILEKLDDILAFADIGDFIDQPVRTYSSGMRLRLAFAVITAVDPEVLIIDEALSVGDAFFQARCVRWLEGFLSRNKTFLCVSHDMFMLQRLCQRGIVLNEAKMVFDGSISEAATLYYRLQGNVPTAQGTPKQEDIKKPEEEIESDLNQTGWTPLKMQIRERTGDGRIMVERVRTNPGIEGGLTVGDWIKVEVEVVANEPVERFNFGFGFRDRSGQFIGGYHSFFEDQHFSAEDAGERKVLKFEIKMDLKPQLYLLVVGVAINHTARDWYDLDCLWDCAKVIVSGNEPFWGLAPLPVRNCDSEKLPTE